VLAWGWFQASVLQAAGAFLDNRQLIRRPGFASAILPAVTVTTNLIHYLLALPVLVVFIALNGGSIGPALLALPVVLLIQYALTLGLAYLVATSQVAFRDTGHLLGLLMMLLMYLTPVFYDPSAVPVEYRLIYDLNPMVHLIAACRAILMHGQWPEWPAVGWVAVASGTLLALGYRVFARARDRFVEEL
jgi:lipopolysaccharide transport system permease protein